MSPFQRFDDRLAKKNSRCASWLSSDLRASVHCRAHGDATGCGPLKGSNLRTVIPADTSPHFVYILRCADGTLYTGYTTDTRRRLAEHNSGRGAKYTKARRPVALVYVEVASKVGDALKREITIKKMRRSQKLHLCALYRARRHRHS